MGVALVDYGTQVRVRDDGEGVKNLGTSSCWGESVVVRRRLLHRDRRGHQLDPLAVLARGWARLKGGQTNTLTVDLAYNDVMIQKGDQLGLAIFGASRTGWSPSTTGATPYTVDLGESSLTLPIVGNLSSAPTPAT